MEFALLGPVNFRAGHIPRQQVWGELNALEVPLQRLAQRFDGPGLGQPRRAFHQQVAVAEQGDQQAFDQVGLSDDLPVQPLLQRSQSACGQSVLSLLVTMLPAMRASMARGSALGDAVIDDRSYSDIRRAGGCGPRRGARRVRRPGVEFYPSATQSLTPALLIDGLRVEKFPRWACGPVTATGADPRRRHRCESPGLLATRLPNI